MELSVLDSDFRRAKLVENWSSLIWTERYSAAGEFELVSNNIAETLDLLPIGDDDDPPTLIAIDGSTVPMIVEDHVIEKKKNSVPQIKTTGRAFESVLDRRVTIRAVTPGVTREEWVIAATSPAIAAYEAAKSIIVDGDATALDIIPEINLLNSTVDPGGTAVEYAVDPKDLHSWMLETLALGRYGLRAELGPILGEIAVIIYKGEDLHTDVVFDVALDQVEDPQYVLSNKSAKNVMITATQNGMEFSSFGAAPSGLTRRVAFQDYAQEITVAAGTDLTNLTINTGKVSLAFLTPVALFSGGISAEIGESYNSLYSLGDLVTLQGEYGLSQVARVTEFVRTQDATGEKAYPTFEKVS